MSLPVSHTIPFVPVTQVLDHSGISFAIPGLYDTADHDLHHSANSCNYSFPFPCMDILHGTFEGVWCGRRYRAKGLRALKASADATAGTQRTNISAIATH